MDLARRREEKLLNECPDGLLKDAMSREPMGGLLSMSRGIGADPRVPHSPGGILAAAKYLGAQLETQRFGADLAGIEAGRGIVDPTLPYPKSGPERLNAQTSRIIELLPGGEPDPTAYRTPDISWMMRTYGGEGG